MRPKRFVITSGLSPKVVPMSYRGGPSSIIASPSGSGNYDIAFTTVDIFDASLTPNWVDITGMSAATTDQDAEVGSVTALRITLNSGTDVTVDISQSDV